MRQRTLTASLALAMACGWNPASYADRVLDDIIVTARKVPESIAAVPLSVQALPGSRLDERNLTSLYDVQHEVPGLVLNNRGMFGAGIALRGVSDEGGGTLAVAPHVNGVHLGRSNLALARIFDVERIEVVKGPQGTLYGRNATGGVINVVTRAPAADFGAGIVAAVGSFDTVRAQAHLNVPSRSVAARVAIAAAAGDGFIRNSVDDRRFAAEDYRAARAALRVQPVEALAIDVMAQRVEDVGGSSELWSPRRDFLPDPRDARLTTVRLADAYLETTDDLATVDVTYRYTGVTLRSVTGYARNSTRAVDDCAGVPRLRGCVRSVLPLRFTQWSQELRLEARATAVDWVLGAFYFESDEFSRFRFAAPLLAPSTINDSRATSSERALAAFGQASVRLAPRWHATAGLRWNRETRRVAEAGVGLADRRTLATAATTQSDPAWRLGLEFRATERVLWFASVATGFKPGGVTAEQLPDGSFDDFDAEHLTAYEAGLSASSPGERWALRASAFRYDFEDMQVRATRIAANQVITDVDNAAAVRIHGLDVSASVTLARRLEATGAFVWMPERDFVAYVDSLSGELLTGNRISRAPAWSASAAVRGRIPVRGIGELSIGVAYNHRSSFYFTKENDPVLAQPGYGLLDLSVRLDPTHGRWHLFASARNVLNRVYFEQVFLQSSPGEPTRCEIGAGWRF